jgi:hypothetical protein
MEQCMLMNLDFEDVEEVIVGYVTTPRVEEL